MNEQSLRLIADELAPALTGGTLARVFQLSALRLAFDFRQTRDNRLLFIAVEPARPRVYLIRRPLRALEKESPPLGQFAQLVRKHLVGARLDLVAKDADERIIRFTFTGRDELDAPLTRTLVAQLTGRSANLFLLDADARILDALRQTHGNGQEPGARYQPPPAPSASPTVKRTPARDELTARLVNASASNRSPSELLDEHDLAFERHARFQVRANAELARLRRELQKRAKLQRNLTADLHQHGDPEAHKRAGDLLLANLWNAERDGARVRVVDYFADDAPTIEIEVAEHKTLPEAAAELFTRYAKAKRAREELNARLSSLTDEIAGLDHRRAALERIIADEDDHALGALIGAEKKPARTASERRTTRLAAQKQPNRTHAPDYIPGTRRYRSSDDFEIIVGRGARENDQLTFRVARPNDLWLHAADYPGAHVIVRNHTRADIPHRTIVEAAQLAAFTSQAKDDSKVSVHYAPRKFISKPKGAVPGLVRLSNFKTLLVEPREAGERILS